MPLSACEIDAIDKHINHLTINSSSLDLVPLLVDNQILTLQDVEQIQKEKDDKAKVTVVFDKLKEKDAEKFYKFCDLLQSSNDETAAKYASIMLQDALKANTIRARRSTKRIRSRAKSSSGDVKSLSRTYAKICKSQDCSVFAWGNNQSYQLGSCQFEKLRVPAINKILSDYKPISIAGGTSNSYFVSSSGKLYELGKSMITKPVLNDDYSHHQKILTTPQPVFGFSNVFVTQVMVHHDGEYAMAITSNGQLYTWGCGPLGNNTTCSTAHPVKALLGKEIIQASCSVTHCAAVTSKGKLYTWGEGKYGGLGHPDCKCHIKPKKVKAFKDKKVKMVACGGTNNYNFTVAITTDGQVWTWGDCKCGKLGRDNGQSTHLPAALDSLNDKNIVKVSCSCECTLALSNDGELFAWGYGDFLHPGFFRDDIIPFPYKVEMFNDIKVADFAVGSSNGIICTKDGKVYTWGYNDYGQLGNGFRQDSLSQLCPVTALQYFKLDRVACGFSHVFAWQLKA
ncbi:E3 ubiquitin-protein ligase HERC2 [Trichoplax sp. H2]|uniref:RCC1-like domain-containing protein n=1 Tax=Trichoplax adhaerens TaxID=10228 RepID=B3RZN4_TRIAD|nr:hypothetical protein TRIADDRAFT_57517 [Trichoplax adhaerens]EDV23872.1 hypothetical protein TRIADDRAFT_57517 [Trichoplax adhaerens]RDD44050.1 E3 ubiquitin-protein ligase HERC2 [Trichoplax sp. H2]|eukprot:XP_002113398.1 hypothetical protein TRIADDRAFT_57517 [Trichoplax adhaerens]